MCVHTDWQGSFVGDSVATINQRHINTSACALLQVQHIYWGGGAAFAKPAQTTKLFSCILLERSSIDMIYILI